MAKRGASGMESSSSSREPLKTPTKWLHAIKNGLGDDGFQNLLIGNEVTIIIDNCKRKEFVEARQEQNYFAMNLNQDHSQENKFSTSKSYPHMKAGGNST